MSNYSFPTKGGLQITTRGKTAVVYIQDDPSGFGLGPVFVVGEMVNGNITARAFIGPKQPSSFQSDIDAMGSLGAWLISLEKFINDAFDVIFGTGAVDPPVPATAPFSVDNVNLALSQYFKLTDTAAGVRISQK